MPIVAWLIFIAAAILEVGGDALIRQGGESAPSSQSDSPLPHH